MSSQMQESDSKFESGRWNQEEHHRFISGILKFGKDWKKIEEVVKSRTGCQVRSHAQKFFLKLHKLQKQKKKQRNKANQEYSQTENQLLKILETQNICPNTPVEIINLLKRDRRVFEQRYPETALNNNQNMKSQAKQKLDQRIQIQIQSDMENTKQLFDLSSTKNLNGTYQSVNEDIEDPDESYLIKVIKMNKDYLRHHQFSQLIDLKQNRENIAKQRKKSFGLLDNQENDEKLDHTLNKIRKGFKMQQI